MVCEYLFEWFDAMFQVFYMCTDVYIKCMVRMVCEYICLVCMCVHMVYMVCEYLFEWFGAMFQVFYMFGMCTDVYIVYMVCGYMCLVCVPMYILYI